MNDEPKSILGSKKEGETASTTSLLKKKREGMDTGEIASTGPITARLAEIHAKEKKSKTGLYLGVGIGAVVVVTLLFILFFSGGLSFMSGGRGVGAGTGEGGSAESVGEGGVPAETPENKTPDPNAPKPPPRAAEIGNLFGGSTGAAPTGLPALPGAATAPLAPPGAPAPPPPPVAAPRPAAPTPAATAAAAQPAPRPAATPVAATPPPATAPRPALTPSAPPMTAPRPDAVAINTPTTVQRGALVPNTDPEATRPSPLGAFSAKKPPAAVQARRAGSARVRYLVDENGNVAQTSVLLENPPGMGFGAAAAQAIQTMKFKPATKAGVPVKMWMMNEIKFP
jgi:TonB family protein